jgi:hypothetical protein
MAKVCEEKRRGSWGFFWVDGENIRFNIDGFINNSQS